MSQDSFDQKTLRPKYNYWMLIVFPLWVLICFIVAQYIVAGLLWVLLFINVPLKDLDSIVLNTIMATLIYLITLVLVIVLPKVNNGQPTTRSDLGITRLPTWKDIALAPAGLVIYFILSAILTLIAANIIPGFNMTQVQNTGFNNARQANDLLLAFVTLVVVAPIAEEILFRGYLFSKLKKYAPVWVAILVTSVFFGVVHGAWNVGVDTFALSIILCILREMTDGIWSSILLHMLKNGIAFYFLFISPALLTTLR